MSDYIDREALINALDELCDRVCMYSKKNRAVMCSACPLGYAFDTVEEFTASDVRPVKWIPVKERLPEPPQEAET